MVRYCQYCGKPVTYQMIENRTRAVCDVCGSIYYEHRKVSVGVRVAVDGKLLLVQRAIEPWKGCWHLPSGYMEVDEEPEQTAEREVKEETGYTIKVGTLVNVITYDDDPRGNGIVLFYDAQLIDGKFIANHEAIAAGFFSPQEIGKMLLAGTCAEQSIREWIDAQPMNEAVK